MEKNNYKKIVDMALNDLETSEIEDEDEDQIKIIKICDAMKELLLEKNKRYGSSALKPNHIFFKGDSTDSILIRLDDKISRIQNNKENKPRFNDVADIIGYCVLLLISMDISDEDILKLID
ncbi:MAG: hypothetical protein LBF97_05630 [Elusimicrobiota bacterium]|jgi:hypothetical protein|nr:hypothetical protein [Elusimicrobiota bacterium]